MPRRRTVNPGDEIGSQTIIREVLRPGQPFRYFLCRCWCGNEHEVAITNLERVEGCRKCSSRNDGMTTTHPREYKSFISMIQRCTNPRNAAWSLYGGRGITVCDRWDWDFPQFVADMGPCPFGCTLARIDPDGPYSPENCRWATPLEQGVTRRNAIYVSGLSLRQFCLKHGLTYATIYQGLRDGRISISDLEAGRFVPRPRRRKSKYMVAGLTLPAFCRKHGLSYHQTRKALVSGEVTVEQLELDYL